MPTITPTGRATIGGSPGEYHLPRSSVTASTGMSLPSLAKKEPEAPVSSTGSGQQAIGEETKIQPNVTLSPQLTAIARRQQKLQQEIQTQRDKEAEWEKRKGDYVSKSEFKAKYDKNAVEALKLLDTEYEGLSQTIIAQSQGADPVAEVRAELQLLKKQQEDDTNKQFDATLKQYKAEVTALTSKDQKKYFFIDKNSAHEHVVQHIVDTWKEDPDKVLTVEEAANDIEEFLRDGAKASKALLDELDGSDKPVEEPEKKTLPPPRTGARTLTQQVESTPSRTYNQFQHLSMKERITQSIARAQK